MIVSHRHRFIFLKTRKTAGTSIELFLFPHCGAEDIVTPLTRTPLTQRVGHRARNHIRPAIRFDPRPAIARVWRLEGWKAVDYHDHIRAADVHGAKLDERHSFSDTTDAMNAAVHGLGVALARARIVAPYLADGRLQRLPGPALTARWSYFIVYPAHRRLKPAAQAFVDWLLALPKD